MAATPYLVSLPSMESMPSRTLRDGVSAVAVNAGSSADALAFVKSQYANDCNAMWDQADIDAIVAATDMADWAFRVRIITPLGATLFDETVEADGTLTRVVLATGTLTLTPGAIADDVVKIDTTYYKFAADPTTGTPDGTVGNPYLVAVAGSNTNALANLRKAINATGTGGVDYAAEIVAAHAKVEATASNATTMNVRALSSVTAAVANTISTTVTATGGADGLAWGATTLTGGIDSTDKVSSLASAMVTALNATADIAGASFNNGTHVLTVAAIADALGDHQVEAFMIPAGADRAEVVGVPGFVASITDGGVAAAALSATLVADSYTVPQVASLFGAAA